MPTARVTTRRRREELRRSAAGPHPETQELADAGLNDWDRGSKPGDSTDLLDSSAGKMVRWVARKGWVEAKR